MRHPTRQQLLDYAESLVDRDAPVSAVLAAHIQGCRRCTREVAAMRRSLNLADAAGELEPSRDLTSQILLAAQQEKRPATGRFRPWAGWLVRGAGVLAVAAAGVLAFTLMLNGGRPAAEAAHAGLPATIDADLGTLRARMRETGLLRRAAETKPATTPAGQALRERAGRAAADRAAAEGFLRENPGHAPALRLLEDAVAREHDALRRLYLGLTP